MLELLKRRFDWWAKNPLYTLVFIFILALLIRFLYFPGNVYFAYDNARDSYSALDILKGDFKLLGPPSSFGGNLHHGPLFFYFLAPIYFLFHNSPDIASAFLRILNAAGVFVAFGLGAVIFGSGVGLITAFLFAISHEQSQYALFFGHPTLAVFFILLFYLGLGLVFFKEKKNGLLLAAISLGLVINSHDVHALLLIPLAILLIIFRTEVKKVDKKIWYIGALLFLVATSPFLVSEIKFNFRTLKGVGERVQVLSNHSSSLDFKLFLNVCERLIADNFINTRNVILPLIFVGLIIWLLKKKQIRLKIIFLVVIFLSGLLPYLISNQFSYYYSAGASIGLLVITSYLIFEVFKRTHLLAVLILGIIIFSNLKLSFVENKIGPNSDFIIQPGMLTSSEKQAVDYIYQTSGNEPFAVGALTVPLEVNTTWSYLFEWYGKDKYGYVPKWFGETAQGFPGNLKVESNRGNLPINQFIIEEPPVGIEQGVADSYYRNENYFTKVVEEKKFGTITVQYRRRY